jgi:ribosomal-protein-alanine N-acetyltransferase
LDDADLDQVVELESVCFSRPWQRVHFECALADPGTLARGAWLGTDLAGYAVGNLDQQQFHLATLAVAPRHRRQGYGSLLLAAVLGTAARAGGTQCSLEVRVGNRPALSLYASAGFQTVRTRPTFYAEPVEDAFVLVRPLGRGRSTDRRPAPERSRARQELHRLYRSGRLP